ncbi:hypothetical protein Q5P01_011974 [Channa striata]|uniref:HD domain-containing protein n=1 Tax=Channa striata TaxID=64152 RepID=A0AA88MQT7_CHASR|nr:hypothetical protein Q5P01_011974 [Channa striata]
MFKCNIKKQQNHGCAGLFNDPVHGHIELHPLLVKIIDTPQFQRLRNIKQLGGACFVFPGASHSRFEHSIGVGYLAGELAKVLKKRLSDDEKDLITDEDILCVEIAGLCHDLGHGPFSHLFDNMFLKAISSKKQHEAISTKMFDHMVEENGLMPLMKLYGLKKEDLIFIKKMINPKNKRPSQSEGRTKGKSFLFEIVSNELNDIDVDKFDYFARDCHYLGIQNNFDHRRFLMLAKLCEVDGEKHICTRDKEEHNVYNMFYTRYYLHRSVYQHRVNKSIELMIRDAFVKAQEMPVEGSNRMLRDVTDNMTTYTKLTDHVFEQILNSSSKKTGIKSAREILQRIISRDLYQCLGETLPVTLPEVFSVIIFCDQWCQMQH